jgi:superfamily II DNA/RNA helicase
VSISKVGLVLNYDCPKYESAGSGSTYVADVDTYEQRAYLAGRGGWKGVVLDLVDHKDEENLLVKILEQLKLLDKISRLDSMQMLADELP